MPRIVAVAVLLCTLAKGKGTARSRLRCGCLRKDTSTVVDRLDGSTYLFLCANPLRNPLLWTVGLVTVLLQMILLVIIVSRVDAVFKGVYACASVTFQESMASPLFTAPEFEGVGVHAAFSVGADGALLVNHTASHPPCAPRLRAAPPLTQLCAGGRLRVAAHRRAAAV